MSLTNFQKSEMIKNDSMSKMLLLERNVTAIGRISAKYL